MKGRCGDFRPSEKIKRFTATAELKLLGSAKIQVARMETEEHRGDIIKFLWTEHNLDRRRRHIWIKLRGLSDLGISFTSPLEGRCQVFACTDQRVRLIVDNDPD